MSAEQNASDRNAELNWFTSSYSGSDGGDCVEVAAADATVHVRDSKNRRGPVLHFSATEWAAFIARARAESFGGS